MVEQHELLQLKRALAWCAHLQAGPCRSPVQSVQLFAQEPPGWPAPSVLTSLCSCLPQPASPPSTQGKELPTFFSSLLRAPCVDCTAWRAAASWLCTLALCCCAAASLNGICGCSRAGAGAGAGQQLGIGDAALSQLAVKRRPGDPRLVAPRCQPATPSNPGQHPPAAPASPGSSFEAQHNGPGQRD